MHRAGNAWAIGGLDRSTNAAGSESGSNDLSGKLPAITKGIVMKPSLTKVSQAPNLTARDGERAARRFLSECASSSPRASLAFSALSVVQALRDLGPFLQAVRPWVAGLSFPWFKSTRGAAAQGETYVP